MVKVLLYNLMIHLQPSVRSVFQKVYLSLMGVWRIRSRTGVRFPCLLKASRGHFEVWDMIPATKVRLVKLHFWTLVMRIRDLSIHLRVTTALLRPRSHLHHRSHWNWFQCRRWAEQLWDTRTEITLDWAKLSLRGPGFNILAHTQRTNYQKANKSQSL